MKAAVFGNATRGRWWWVPWNRTSPLSDAVDSPNACGLGGCGWLGPVSQRDHDHLDGVAGQAEQAV